MCFKQYVHFFRSHFMGVLHSHLTAELAQTRILGKQLSSYPRIFEGTVCFPFIRYLTEK